MKSKTEMEQFKKLRIVELNDRGCASKIETKQFEISKEPAKAIIKELILYSSKRLDIHPLQGESKIREHFSKVILDGAVINQYVMCSKCKTLIGYKSARGGLSTMARHLEFCKGASVRKGNPQRKVHEDPKKVKHHQPHSLHVY